MRFLWLSMLFVAASFTAQAQENPVAYIELFNQEFAQLQDLQIEYSSFVAHLGSEVAEQKRLALLERVKTTHDRFQNLEAYPKDQGMKSNTLKVLDIMLKMGNTDYLAEAEAKTGCSDCFEAILLQNQLIDKEAENLSKAMLDIQKSVTAFAKKQEVELLDDGDDHETLLGKIGRINNYLQEINLATLEVQYADAAIIAALNNKDLDQAKKNVKDLSKAASNASRRLKQLDRIKEDATAIYQAERLVDYYAKAAKDLYPDMLSAFDRKGNVINDKVDLYNKTIATLNNNIQTITSKYMDAKLQLQQRHIPKPKAKVART